MLPSSLHTCSGALACLHALHTAVGNGLLLHAYRRVLATFLQFSGPGNVGRPRLVTSSALSRETAPCAVQPPLRISPPRLFSARHVWRALWPAPRAHARPSELLRASARFRCVPCADGGVKVSSSQPCRATDKEERKHDNLFGQRGAYTSECVRAQSAAPRPPLAVIMYSLPRAHENMRTWTCACAWAWAWLLSSSFRQLPILRAQPTHPFPPSHTDNPRCGICHEREFCHFSESRQRVGEEWPPSPHTQSPCDHSWPLGCSIELAYPRLCSLLRALHMGWYEPCEHKCSHSPPMRKPAPPAVPRPHCAALPLPRQWHVPSRKRGLRPGEEIFVSYGREYNLRVGSRDIDDERQGWGFARRRRQTNGHRKGKQGATMPVPAQRARATPAPPRGGEGGNSPYRGVRVFQHALGVSAPT